MFNGLGMSLGALSRVSNAESRSISAENRNGAKGMGAMDPPGPNSPSRFLGTGWKCHAYDVIEPLSTFVMADIDGPGAIQSIWLTGSPSRNSILRIYWENQKNPSVECPVADFFALPWFKPNFSLPKEYFPAIASLPVAVNPRCGMNCFWEMPFHYKCKITIENTDPANKLTLYYQVNYTLTEIPEDSLYFHAQFRRSNPLPYMQDFTILDNIASQGQYVGTSMGFGINNCGWWGEGEIKFFIDEDRENPTICGTGTEDYFGGSYNWDVGHEYQIYSAPFMGHHQVIKPDGLYSSQQRHAAYRWHVMDPICFKYGLKVTMQALGWRANGTFLPEQPDICSTAFWYQKLPSPVFPHFPDNDYREII